MPLPLYRLRALCLAVSLPLPVHAEAPPGSEIVVTATRSAQTLDTVPASASVISGDHIAATPARTIDDVLRRLPSVDLPMTSSNEQHPTNTMVSMRGLSGIRALVMLDGVPINDPFFGYVQWSEVPLATIDRVEVVRGGGATLWGNYAMGGVINILTRPIDRTGLDAEVAGGSRGSYRAATHAALAGHGFGLGLDAGISHSDGYVEQVESARGAITVPSSFTAHRLALSGNAQIAATLTARGRVSYDDNDQTFLTRLNTNRQRNWRATGALGWTPAKNATLDLTLFHNDERFVTDNSGTPDGAGAYDAEYVQNRHVTKAHDSGASLIWTQTRAGLLRSWSVGADYHGVHGRDDAAIFDQSNAFLRTDTGAGDQRFLGAFVQADVRPLDRLQVLFSLRYQDFYSSHGVDNAPGGLGQVTPRHDTDVDPRLSIRYQLPAGFALRAAAYRAFRAPTLDNLYRAASVPGYILYGNAALAPETLSGAEAGFDLNRGTLRLAVTGWVSRISHVITYRYLDAADLPTGFDIGARLINAGQARSRGIEAELNWQPSDRLTATLGYTYADSVVTHNPEDPASVGLQQSGVPRHRVTADLDWTGPLGIVVSPRLRYLSRTNGDPDGIYRTDAHVIADLGLDVPLRRGLHSFLQIENLFDRRYIGTNDGFTAPLYGKPLTVTGGFRLKLG